MMTTILKKDVKLHPYTTVLQQIS